MKEFFTGIAIMIIFIALLPVFGVLFVIDATRIIGGKNTFDKNLTDVFIDKLYSLFNQRGVK